MATTNFATPKKESASITGLPKKSSDIDYIKQIISPLVSILRSATITVPMRGDIDAARQEFSDLLDNAPKGVTLEIRARIVDYARSLELGWYTSLTIGKRDPEEIDDIYQMADAPYYYCGRIRL